MNVGTIIKDRRIELGLTLEDVAAALNVSKSTILRYETGAIENMGIDKVQALAAVLKMKPVDLLGWGGKQEPENNDEAAVMVKKELMDAVAVLNQLPENKRQLALEMLKTFAKHG